MASIERMRAKQPGSGRTVKRRCGHEEPLASVESRDCAECKKKRSSSAKKFPPDSRRGRLPHGARFEVEYDGEAHCWRGFLMLTLAGRKMFSGSAGGVFSLLQKLDTQYRAWASAQGEAEV